MAKYQLKIELLSDMCVSDGGVYNSVLDTDICHDRYGFPFIPAKRLRGCLRECALELCEWGRDVSAEKLFGKAGSHLKGDHRSAVRMGNAYLEGYAELRAEAQAHTEAGSVIFHTQNVLNHYSYIRTQTSINYKTGVAEDASLRTMRVANKGLIFFADVEMPEDEAIKKQLEDCCAIFKHIGIARTRGLGEIQATLVPAVSEMNEENEIPAALEEGADYLAYTITLEEPMICKSVNGGEARTLDYIEGSKVLGLIGGQLKNAGEDFLDFMNKGELFCSNAYITERGRHLTEVPAGYFSIKNNKTDYIDKAYERGKGQEAAAQSGIQLHPMKHCYAGLDENGNLICRSVRVEERYHHRRPEDKSIGRAMESDSANSHFYQISSMEAGQTLAGYIYGDPAQIEQIYRLLSQKNIYYMGYGRSSEYGKVQVRITETRKGALKTQLYKDFRVKLEAPAIIYNENAMYSTDVRDLIEEVEAVLGIKTGQGDEVRKFVGYTTVGGYNVTWGARKPVIEAFDKGSELIFHLEQETELTLPPVLYIGERISEGYGEISVQELSGSADRYRGKLAGRGRTVVRADRAGRMSELMTAICDDLFRQYIKIKAAEEVEVLSKNARATVSNMILMCKESDSLDEVRKTVRLRYADKVGDTKDEKYKTAQRILKTSNEQAEKLLADFREKYGDEVSEYKADHINYQMDYLTAYLTELKYRIRETEQKGDTDR